MVVCFSAPSGRISFHTSVAQWEKHREDVDNMTLDVLGSIPSAGTLNGCGAVLARLPSKHEVTGSNPVIRIFFLLLKPSPCEAVFNLYWKFAIGGRHRAAENYLRVGKDY